MFDYQQSASTWKVLSVQRCCPFLCFLWFCGFQSNLKSPTSVRQLWKRKQECVCPLQFGEIYEWTKPKSVRVYTQREFGRRDLRSAVWVIIQSSRSHISHFESHRLWEGTDLSYTQVAHVHSEKKRQRKAKTTRAHKLIYQMFFWLFFFFFNLKAMHFLNSLVTLWLRTNQ